MKCQDSIIGEFENDTSSIDSMSKTSNYLNEESSSKIINSNFSDHVMNFINNNFLQSHNSWFLPGIAVGAFVYLISNKNQIRNVLIISILHSSMHMIVDKLKKIRDEKIKNMIFE